MLLGITGKLFTSVLPVTAEPLIELCSLQVHKISSGFAQTLMSIDMHYASM